MKGTMKTLMAVAVLGSVLSLQPASAGVFDGAFFSPQMQGYGGPHGKGGRTAPPPREMRVAPPREVRMPPPRERGHLTDEERRQLHRDLDKANRELYRERRPAAPPPSTP